MTPLIQVMLASVIPVSEKAKKLTSYIVTLITGALMLYFFVEFMMLVESDAWSIATALFLMLDGTAMGLCISFFVIAASNFYVTSNKAVLRGISARDINPRAIS